MNAPSDLRAAPSIHSVFTGWWKVTNADNESNQRDEQLTYQCTQTHYSHIVCIFLTAKLKHSVTAIVIWILWVISVMFTLFTPSALCNGVHRASHWLKIKLSENVEKHSVTVNTIRLKGWSWFAVDSHNQILNAFSFQWSWAGHVSEFGNISHLS